MKKIISVLLCLILTLSLCGCSSDKALVGKDIIGNVGDTVDVVFEIEKDIQLAAADLVLEYDSTVLEYVSTNKIYEFESGYVSGNSPEAGNVKVAIVTLDYPTKGGDLFSVSFKILKKCKSGSNVKVSCTSCCDLEYNKFELGCKGAKVFSK